MLERRVQGVQFDRGEICDIKERIRILDEEIMDGFIRMQFFFLSKDLIEICELRHIPERFSLAVDRFEFQFSTAAGAVKANEDVDQSETNRPFP